MSIKIQERSIEEWDKDLDQFHHSIFLSIEWIKAVADESHTPLYLDFISKDKKTGKLSGLIINRSKTKTYLYFYAGPALKILNNTIYSQCLDVLYKFAKNRSYFMISFGSFDNRYSLKYKGYKYLNFKRVEFVISLNKGHKNIKFNNIFKRNLKKGEKAAPTIKNSSDINKIDVLMDLLMQTKKIRKNKYQTDYYPFYLTNLSKKTLQRLLRSGIAKVHYTVKKGSIDCMEFNLEKNKNVYMLLKGTNSTGYKNGLSSYLSYSLITEYINKDYITYNQGGRPAGHDGDGLEIYKKSMGAEKIIVYGAISNFLTYPYRLLNPLFYLVQFLPKSLINSIKKLFW